LGLSAIDIIVIFFYLAAITGFGVWLSRFQTDSRAYFLGNRNLPWWAICLSIVATETSVLTFIGVPALSYAGDLQFIQLAFGFLIARILLAAWFLPAFLKKDTYTVYGFLSERFGGAVRSLGAGLFFVTQVLGSGVRLYAGALVLAAVLGLENVMWAIVVMAVVTIIYTWAGGISAVIWTDVLQAAIMLGGGVLALWLLLGMFPDGAGQVFATAAAEGKLRLLDFSFDPTDMYSIWAGLIGGTVHGMASHGTDQVLAQRLLTSRNLSQGKRALIGSGVIIIPQFLLFLVVGVLLYYFYQLNPPQVAFESPDRIFPHFIITHFPPVAAGLVVAAMFGATMSTLDSGIQALSCTTVMDVVRPLMGKKRAQNNYLGLSRAFTVFWGAALAGVALLAGGWGPVLETGLKVASYTYGPLLALFLLGLFSPIRGQRAVLIGAACGTAGVALVLAFGSLAWTWNVLTGCSITVVAALLFDKLSPGGELKTNAQRKQ
jgi:solute:Na+ symporter, SSS family